MTGIAGLYQFVADPTPPLKWYQRLAIKLHLREAPPRFGHYERIPDVKWLGEFKSNAEALAALEEEHARV